MYQHRQLLRRYDVSLGIDLPKQKGSKAAIVGRSGYPAIVVWTREGNFIARVVPRSDRGDWTVRSITLALRRQLIELGFQVQSIAYEAAWREADGRTRRLLHLCKYAALCWDSLHPAVAAREVKLRVRAPWSDDTEIAAPEEFFSTCKNGGCQHPIESLDHLLIFAGESAGRIALNVECKERELEAALPRCPVEDEFARTGTIR